jgi:PhoPQ-activated pathogenicity-related protein
VLVFFGGGNICCRLPFNWIIKTMTKILDKTNNKEYDKIVDRYNQLEKRFDVLLTLLKEVINESNLTFKGNQNVKIK